MNLEAACAKYIGVPYLYRGADPRGWDCWGLVQYIGVHELALSWPSYAEAYAASPLRGDAAVADAVAAHLGEWSMADKPATGHVLCFDRKGTGRMAAGTVPRVFHVAIALNGREMIHVREGHGTVIERFDSFVWSRYFAGAWVKL